MQQQRASVTEAFKIIFRCNLGMSSFAAPLIIIIIPREA
jgi:ligand-binding sensor protein